MIDNHYTIKEKTKRILSYSKKISIYKEQGYVCFDCNKTLTNEQKELHHVIPLYLGGNNIRKNLIVICENCHKYRHREIYNMLKYLSTYNIKKINFIDIIYNSNKENLLILSNIAQINIKHLLSYSIDDLREVQNV